jgi:SET domain-containing protein
MPRKNSARRKQRPSNQKSSQQPFRVGRSRTGLGLFAVASIKKGAFIIEYWGRPIRSEEADKLPTKYLFDLGNGWTIDGADRQNIARYINHSCRPNAEARTGRRSVSIYATKTIRPGDEITYDYGREYFERILQPIGCRCVACAERQRTRTPAPGGRRHSSAGARPD